MHARCSPHRVKHIAASWHSKAGALSKNVVRRKLHDPPFIRLHHRVRRRMRHREVVVVARLRCHRSETPVRFCEYPTPVRSRKARLPRDERVAPIHEILNHAFAAEVILHFSGALNDCFDDLSGPRRVASVAWWFRTDGWSAQMPKPLRIQVIHCHDAVDDREQI